MTEPKYLRETNTRKYHYAVEGLYTAYGVGYQTLPLELQCFATATGRHRSLQRVRGSTPTLTGLGYIMYVCARQERRPKPQHLDDTTQPCDKITNTGVGNAYALVHFG